MQRIVLAEPSVLHLSKLMEGNRKQRETKESQSVLHATHTPSTHPGFIWDSTRTSGCGGKLFKGHVQVYRQTYHTDMEGSTQAPHIHAGKLIVLLYNHFTSRIASVLMSLSGCFILIHVYRQSTKYNMHLEADQKQYIFQRHLGVNVASTSCHTTQIHA